MPVKVYWLDETKKDMVWYDFEGEWTWDEFYPMYEEASCMIKSQPHRVDVLMDFRHNLSLPPHALTHMKGITDRQPDNTGLAIFVTTHRFISVMLNSAIKFYPKIEDYYVVAPTLEDAYTLINKDREQEQSPSLES
ncbi:MAG: hypothetical protein ACFE0Q_01750 [Anaerolineae bacterium]